MSEKHVRILLVDDHHLMRDGLRLMLAKHSDLTVVGEAADGREALARVQELQPDIILLDLDMPGQNGIDCAKALRKLQPGIKIIILTGSQVPEWVDEAMRATVSGFVLKTEASSELVRAIRLAVAGQIYLAPEVTTALVQSYNSRQPEAGELKASVLSAREQEVLKRIADGQPTKEIAHALGLSAKTIEARRSKLMAKLGLQSVAELTKYAIRQGISSL